MASSSRPAFFNTLNLAQSLIETEIVANMKKKTLVPVTSHPRGLEFDIVEGLEELGYYNNVFSKEARRM